MVFGLWTFNINSDVYKNSELRDFIIEFLNRSRDQGLSDLFPDVIVEAFKATGLPKSILLNYFKNLNYQFTDNHQQGLDYFEKKLKDLKLLGEFSCK